MFVSVSNNTLNHYSLYNNREKHDNWGNTKREKYSKCTRINHGKTKKERKKKV